MKKKKTVDGAPDPSEDLTMLEGEYISPQELLRQHMTTSGVDIVAKSADTMFFDADSGQYKCDICDKSFAAAHLVRNHRKLHGEPVHKCLECSGSFTTAKYLEQHMERVHQKIKKVTCKVCGWKLYAQKELTRHMMSHSDLRPFKCTTCDKSFKRKAALEQHIRIHTGERNYICNVCGKAFNRPHVLKSHKMIHTDEKPYKCTFCSYACRDNSSLRKHEATHMGSYAVYTCKLCPNKYRDKWRLKQHVASDHLSIDVRKYECDYCGNKYKNRGNFIIHIRATHMRILPFSCPVCHKKFRTKINMQHHEICHYDDRKYSCPHCQLTFKSKQNRDRHQIIHEPNKQIPCPTCGRLFTRKHRMMKHQKLHLDRKKNTPCPLCGICFYNTNAVAKHVRYIHAKKRIRYECDYCGDKMLNKPGLIKHIRQIHIAVKKHKCEICGMRFKNLTPLKMHGWTKHKIQYKWQIIKSPPREELPEIKQEVLDPDEMDLATLLKRADDELKVLPTKLERISVATRVHQEPRNVVIQRSEKTELEHKPEEKPNESIEKPAVEVTVTNELAIDNSENDQQLKIAKSMISDNAFDLNKVPEVIFDDYIESNLKKRVVETDSPKKTKRAKRDSDSDFETEIIDKDIAIDLPTESSNGRPKRNLKSVNYKAMVETNLEEAPFEKTERNIEKQKFTSWLNKSLTVWQSDNAEVSGSNPGDTKNKSKSKRKTVNKKKLNKNNTGHESDANKNDDDETGDEKVDEANAIENIVIDKVQENYGKFYHINFNMVQCYVCFKLFDSRKKLLEHCAEHFPKNAPQQINKCPICNFECVSRTTNKTKTIRYHMKTKHNITLSSRSNLIESKNDKFVLKLNNKDTNNTLNEIEIVPTLENMNRCKMYEMDRKNRELKSQSTFKSKLVKTDKGWIVQNDLISTNESDKVFSKTKEDLSDDVYLKEMMDKGKLAKKEGRTITYPCDKCNKVCLGLSGLTSHRRIHNSNAKPYKPKVWKHKIKNNKTKPIVKKVIIDNSKPQPIKGRHKCDDNLKLFYKNCIRGSNIAFDQFLKIYNKIDRDEVKEFDPHENYLRDPNVVLENDKVELDKKTINDLVKKSKYVRRICISKQLHLQRQKKINELRRNLKNNC